MKIGIIGKGNMGSVFAKNLTKKHEIFIGSRDVKSAAQTVKSFGKNVKVGSIKEAVEFGEVIILAVGWHAVDEVLKSAPNLENKILVDITNPFNKDMNGLAVDTKKTSAAEEIQKISKATVVKAFNTVFSHVIESGGKFNGQKASVLFCGDDAIAKKKVAKIIEDLDFEAIDIGPLSAARILEELGYINIALGYALKMGTNQAFKLLKR